MMKFRWLLCILSASVLFLTASCHSEYDRVLMSGDVQVKYKAAFEYFNSKKYLKAAELFESLLVPCEGTARADTVMYYQGLSNFKYGDLMTAESNFERFVELYPVSPFTPSANFLRIECLYRSTLRYELDQSTTRQALGVISQYMYENPTSEYYGSCQKMMDDLHYRLEKKAFESARLYYVMEDYKAAVYAFKTLLKSNAESSFREEIKYHVAVAAYKYAHHSVPAKQNDRYISFIDAYYDFVGEYPESPLRKTLDIYFIRAQKRIDVEYDIPEEYRDLDLGDIKVKLDKQQRRSLRKMNKK